MESITLDLCTLLFPPLGQREILLYFLDKCKIEIICYSYLPRPVAKDALQNAGLLRFIDDIIYGPVPAGIVSRPDATVKSCIPKDKWPRFMKLFA